jgi:excisionase family DNA binding protein
MLTVPEAARRAGVTPGTIRRWIREGRLRARKPGTQHLIDDANLLARSQGDTLPPLWLACTATGEPMPKVVAFLRRQRRGH